MTMQSEKKDSGIGYIVLIVIILVLGFKLYQSYDDARLDDVKVLDYVKKNISLYEVLSCYDESKRFAEAIVVAYRDYHHVDTRIIRIFNTYGPRMRLNDGRVVPEFISQVLKGKNITIYGDGTQTRSFCYVSDLVRGMIGVMEHSYMNTKRKKIEKIKNGVQ